MSIETPPPVSSPHSPRPKWYSHSYDGLQWYYLAAACGLLPRTVRFACAKIVADVFRHRMPQERAAVQRNIRRVLPEASPAIVSQLTQSLFRHFAYYFSDLLSLNRQSLHSTALGCAYPQF